MDSLGERTPEIQRMEMQPRASQRKTEKNARKVRKVPDFKKLHAQEELHRQALRESSRRHLTQTKEFCFTQIKRHEHHETTETRKGRSELHAGASTHKPHMTPAPHLWRGWETPRGRRSPKAADHDIAQGMQDLSLHGNSHGVEGSGAHEDEFVEEEFKADPAALESIVTNIGVVDVEQQPLQGEELEQHLTTFGMEDTMLVERRKSLFRGPIRVPITPKAIRESICMSNPHDALTPGKRRFSLAPESRKEGADQPPRRLSFFARTPRPMAPPSEPSPVPSEHDTAVDNSRLAATADQPSSAEFKVPALPMRSGEKQSMPAFAKPAPPTKSAGVSAAADALVVEPAPAICKRQVDGFKAPLPIMAATHQLARPMYPGYGTPMPGTAAARLAPTLPEAVSATNQLARPMHAGYGTPMPGGYAAGILQQLTLADFHNVPAATPTVAKTRFAGRSETLRQENRLRF